MASATASSSFCLTCSSEIRQPGYITPCCSTPICSSCLARNPRLKEYIPCLRCGDVRTASGSAAIARGRAGLDRRREEEERGMFVIDDEDDGDQPPAYDDIASCKSNERRRSSSRERRSEEEQEEMELVEIKHPVSRSDTILSIARRYAADPHEILQLNNLPPSVLSTQPHLLRTRRTVIVSRRAVPKSKLEDPTVFDSGLEMPVDPDEEAKREKERAVKRFQLMTKTVDPGVGKAYLGLSEMEEENDLLAEEMEESVYDARYHGSGITSGDKDGATERNSGKKGLREESNRQERAIEAFFDDDHWEQEVGQPERGSGVGKWKTVGNGQNMGIKVYS